LIVLLNEALSPGLACSGLMLPIHRPKKESAAPVKLLFSIRAFWTFAPVRRLRRRW